MRPALYFLCKPVLFLAFFMNTALLAAQEHQVGKNKKQQIADENRALPADTQKQAELIRFYEQSFQAPAQYNDTVARYLADIDQLIDSQTREHIPFPFRLRHDCRVLIRRDLRELTENGLRSGYSFSRIAAINNAYLRDISQEYSSRYRPGAYRRIPEFGRNDYLKAIRNIFTTIVTLRVSSFTEKVNVVIYSMRDNKLMANISGVTELVQPLESGAYVVELSKPGYKPKLRKVVLGKYPKTITIREALVMQ